MSTEKFSEFAAATSIGASDELVGLQGGANKRFPQSVVGGGILQKTVTLNNDQIKALPSTPVEIVAAPGANKVIVLLGGVSYFNFTVDYVNPNVGSPSELALAWWDGIQGHGKCPASNFIGDLDISNMSGKVAGIGAPKLNATAIFSDALASRNSTAAYVINSPIVLYDDDNDSGSDYTGGDPANTLKVTVLYAVVDVL